jgi:polyisoprenyl-teichoic acid--peptidoglycan teichoic acid transferase
MQPASSRFVRRRPPLDRTSRIVLIVFAVLALITLVVAFIWARNFFGSWSLTDLGSGAPAISDGANPGEQAQPGTNPQIDSSQPLQGSGNAPQSQPWDGNSRVTILLLGLDYRDCDIEGYAECDQQGVARSDSMMLVTIDPLSKTVGMLSIPRDLWVQIPGYEYARINTAYFLGEVYKLPEGGPGLAMETVEQFLGVPVQYYGLVDFRTFERLIDEIGGIKIRPTQRIKLDPVGPIEPFWLDPGTYVVDGPTALSYARNRKTDGGDTDRSKRQQEVILAVRERILQFDQMPSLITKAPKLYADLQSGIRTNLTLSQIIQLGVLGMSIPEENIKRGVIGPPYQVEESVTPDGQWVYVPVPDQIRILRDEIFSADGPVGPGAAVVAPDADPLTLAKEEQARIVVKNGSSTEGMAGRTGEYLRQQGLNVTGEGNADQLYSTAVIIDYSGKPYTISYLTQLVGGTDFVRIISRYDPNAQVDIEFILGTDFAGNNSLP